jgi:hypothetical protein
MVFVPLLLASLLGAPPVSPVPGVPLPPGGVVDGDLTRVFAERATAETREALARLERDTSRSTAEKDELKKRMSRLKIAVFTSTKTLDELVAFYEKEIPKARFVFGVRDLASDLSEGIRSGVIKADAGSAKKLSGQRGRSARWHGEEGLLGIDIEDTLIDPRDGKVTRKTVVLVTSMED